MEERGRERREREWRGAHLSLPSICPFIPGGGFFFLLHPSSFAERSRGGGGGGKRRDAAVDTQSRSRRSSLGFNTRRRCGLPARTHKTGQLQKRSAAAASSCSRSNTPPMTAAICRAADLLKRESGGDLIVISERISVINGSRSMASPAALYISGNKRHSRPNEEPLPHHTPSAQQSPR